MEKFDLINSPESTVAFRDRLILQHSHRGLESEFLLFLGHSNIVVQIHRR